MTVLCCCCCCCSQCLISNCRAAKGEKSLSLLSVFVVRWPMGGVFGCGDVMWSRPPASCCLLQPKFEKKSLWVSLWAALDVLHCLSWTCCSKDTLHCAALAWDVSTRDTSHFQSAFVCMFYQIHSKLASIEFWFFHSTVSKVKCFSQSVLTSFYQQFYREIKVIFVNFNKEQLWFGGVSIKWCEVLKP